MEIINKSVCRGVAGRRTSATPKGVVIHNDAGSVNATAKHYVNALEAMSVGQLENGFAHYYIDMDTIARVEDTYNKAWHTANTDGNANYVGYEVCQSMGASDADFLANEQATFKQVAEDLKYWKLPANRDTIKLHNQFSATACPHRSQALHGNGVACQDYFIQEVKKYMGVAPSPQPSPTPQPKPPVTPSTPQPSGYPREYNENGTMYANERNWVKRTPTKSAPIMEWQAVGQGIKYHKVVWSDGIVWLQLNYGGGGQAFVAYADAVGTGFGRKYGYCV